MIESSNKTIGPWDFKTDNWSVIVGIAEDNPSYGTILSEAEHFQVRHEDKCLSEEDKDDLLQQKEFVNSLFNEGSISNGDETVTFYDEEPIIEEDIKKLVYLNGQRKIVGQTSKVVTVMEDQNYILIKDAKVVS
jgi:hypothetical protein